MFNFNIIFRFSLPTSLKNLSRGDDPSYKKQISTGASVSVPQLPLLQFLIVRFSNVFVKFDTAVNEDTATFENELSHVSSELSPLWQLHLLFKFKSRHLILEESGS